MDRPNGAPSTGLASASQGGRQAAGFAGNTIAGEPELEAFSKQPVLERRVGEALRGILAETATTGVVRYSWSLLRPLVAHILEQVLREYDAEASSEHMVGPPRPPPYGAPGSIAQTVERFRQLLYSFNQPPWTLQRICEILLEPRKQYSHLHKLSLALEKCLLVTSELCVPPSSSLPPPPLLSSLGRVNDNPPSVYQAMPNTLISSGVRHAHLSGHEAGAGRGAEDEDGTAFTGSLLDIRMGGVGGVSSAPTRQIDGALLEDHWPEDRGTASTPPRQPSGLVLPDFCPFASHSPPGSPLPPAAAAKSSPGEAAAAGVSAPGPAPPGEAVAPWVPGSGKEEVKDGPAGVLAESSTGQVVQEGKGDAMQVDSVGLNAVRT